MQRPSRMKTFYLAFISLFFIFQNYGLAQTSPATLIFEGIIQGNAIDTSHNTNWLSNPKKVILEDVNVSVFENGRLKKRTHTNRNGAFHLSLKSNSLLKMRLSKNGYNDITLIIDTRAMPSETDKKEYLFNNTAFFMNTSFNNKDDSNELIGRLYFNKEKHYLDFKAEKKKGLLNNLLKHDKNVKLLKRAVAKNKSNFIPKMVSPPANTVENKDKKEIQSNFEVPSSLTIKNIQKQTIAARKKEIEKLREQLEKDKLLVRSKEDSLLVASREEKIKTAEVEIEVSKKIIDLQDSKILIQEQLLFVSIFTLVLVLILLLVVYKYYKEKKKTYTLLETTNRNVFDSISYARRIQQSILTEEKEIKRYLPDSFIYYKPKDIVSGDFYWFSHHDEKLIIAAIDCTGHGVPGAFMSLIGNTLLHEIIMEKQLFDPGLILKHLNRGVLKALHQNKEDAICRDGMEMSLCVIDKGQNTIQYAGAKNPVYIVNNKVLSIIKANIQSIGGRNLLSNKEPNVEFLTHTIPLQKDTCIYLFSDGYMDQFGGDLNTKFNNARFRQLLLNIQHLDMEKQKERLDETFQVWKGKGQQIDDILVIGIRL